MLNSKKITVVTAILSLVPNAKVVCIGGKITQWLDDRPQPSDEEIAEKVAELEAQAEIEAKYKAIEDAIYKFYPAKQQAQDEKWVSSFTTKLKAQGVADLEVKIVDMATSFFSGTNLSEVIADVDDEQKPLFEKLVKVGIRTEWAELCVTEGKSAIAENREPVYPEFPVIN